MKADRGLRAALLVLLAVLIAFPHLWDAPPAADGVVRVGAPLDSAHLGRLVAAGTSGVLVRDAADPPGPAELERLAAVSAPLVVVLPDYEERLAAQPPAAVRSGRTAAVAYSLHGTPGDSARIRIRDAVGVIDSARVALDSAGHADGAFRVRPRRAGWQEWMVEWEERVRVVGAWADSAAPPRVLVHAGAPGWESKFLVRALEESGARVTARYDLGRGLAVGAGGLTPAALGEADVVVVLDGAPLGPAQARLLAGWAERGGGVVLTGDRAAAPGFGVVRDAGAAAPVGGETLQWRLPPELAPLPHDPVRVTAAPLGNAVPGAAVLARSGAGAVLASRPLGQGRAASFGVVDTWRWRMEAGRLAEHREFWRSLVDHMAALAPGLTVRPASAAVAAPVEISAWTRPGETPVSAVDVVTPGGGVHRVTLDSAGAGLTRGRYVPARAGVHRVRSGGHVAGFRAGAEITEGGWGPAALLAARSGGTAAPAESTRAVLHRLAAGRPESPWRPARELLLAMIVVLAGSAWALRRLRGLPQAVS